MCIRSASSPSTVLWAFHTIQPSSCICDTPLIATILPIKVIHSDIMPCVHCCYSVHKAYVRISHKRRGTKFGVYGTKQHKILVWFSLQHQPASRGQCHSGFEHTSAIWLSSSAGSDFSVSNFSSFWCCRPQLNSISDLTFCCSLCFVSRRISSDVFNVSIDCLTWLILDVIGPVSK